MGRGPGSRGGGSKGMWIEGRGLWVRVRGGRGGYEGNPKIIKNRYCLFWLFVMSI